MSERLFYLKCLVPANYELDIDGPEVYGFGTVTQSNARCYWLTVWEIIE